MSALLPPDCGVVDQERQAFLCKEKVVELTRKWSDHRNSIKEEFGDDPELLGTLLGDIDRHYGLPSDELLEWALENLWDIREARDIVLREVEES